jgi:uncharacterized protein (TIGR02246 family)
MQRALVALMVFVLCGSGAHAQKASSATEKAVQALFDKQAADWNRGDLDTFATCYKNSPEILFVGAKKVSRGYAEMLARYHAQYPTREAMGTLTFSDVEVQPLDARFATATGKFHLKRTEAGGGDASGSYMLVLEKTTEGWKIVRDVTMAAPAE